MENNKAEASQFYTRIANVARSRNISISVVTMEGEDCSMENLGILYVYIYIYILHLSLPLFTFILTNSNSISIQYYIYIYIIYNRQSSRSNGRTRRDCRSNSIEFQSHSFAQQTCLSYQRIMQSIRQVTTKYYIVVSFPISISISNPNFFLLLLIPLAVI